MLNLTETLESWLPSIQIYNLKKASEIASKHGVLLYLVGGSVRDILLDIPFSDIDISMLNADHDFPRILAKGLAGKIISTSQFGTSKLLINNDIIDLATARNEKYEQPGALPTVCSGNIREDMARRDFTVNAIAVSLSLDSWGNVFDPFKGIEDLRNKQIRTLHPNSFIDDPTRIFRAIRYAERLSFKVEDNTISELNKNIRYLDLVKGDRIRHEMEKIFQEDRAIDMLAKAQKLSVLSTVHTSLRLKESLLKKLGQTIIKDTRKRRLIFLSLLTHESSRIQRSGIMRRLNLDTKTKKIVSDTSVALVLLSDLTSPDITYSQYHKVLGPLDSIAIEACLFAIEDQLTELKLKTYLEEKRLTTTILSGQDLVKLGIPEGPQIGRVLEKLLLAKMDEQITTREEEEAFTRELIR